MVSPFVPRLTRDWLALDFFVSFSPPDFEHAASRAEMPRIRSDRTNSRQPQRARLTQGRGDASPRLQLALF